MKLYLRDGACSSYPQNKHLQPLRAAVLLEEFLENQALARYRPGLRYFFGHPLPAA